MVCFKEMLPVIIPEKVDSEREKTGDKDEDVEPNAEDRPTRGSFFLITSSLSF